MTATRQIHGLVNTYKYGCRCDECRDANRVHQNAANARRRLDSTGADLAGHGKRSTYVNWSCRCLACCDASSAAQRVQRELRKGRAK